MSDRRRFLKGLTSIPLAPEESLLSQNTARTPTLELS